MASKVFTKSLQLANGMKMPLVGLGTWQSKPGEVREAVKCALLAGYQHIDCAYLYLNETEVGQGLKEVFDQGKIKREDVFITSKLWNTYHHPEDVKGNLLDSMKMLGLEYLDLYLMHWPFAYQRGGDHFPRDSSGNLLFDDISYVETWKAMEKLQDEGLVKAIGVSNFNSVQVQDILNNCRIKPVVNQVEIHSYFGQEKLTNFCRERGIAMTAYSPLSSPQRPWTREANSNPLEDPVIKEIAAKYNKSPAQVIIRWLTQRDIVVLPKSVTPSRIQQNIELADFELTAEEMQKIKALDKNMRLIGNYCYPDGRPVLKDETCPNFPFNIEF